MNILTYFKKYYYLSIILVGSINPTESLAQVATECVQAGGSVPCTIADLTYTGSVLYVGQIFEKILK